MRPANSMVRLILLCVVVGGVLGIADAVQAEPPGAALARSGWAAIQAGKLEDATRAFGEVIAADPQDAMLHLGAGLAA